MDLQKMQQALNGAPPLHRRKKPKTNLDHRLNSPAAFLKGRGLYEKSCDDSGYLRFLGSDLSGDGTDVCGWVLSQQRDLCCSTLSIITQFNYPGQLEHERKHQSDHRPAWL
jgi:hypothetical protein